MFSPIFTMFTYFPFRAYSTVLILCAISWYTYKRLYCGWEKGKISRWQGVAAWLLVTYTLLLLFFTVLGRRSLDYYRYNFNVGYSFRDAYYNGTPETLQLIAVNIAMFVPIGFLGTLAFKHFGFLKGLLFGVMLTASIELSQLVLRNGTCEIDDLISNTLGTLCGCFFAELLRPIGYRVRNHLRKYRPETASPQVPALDEENVTIVYYQIELMN